MCKSSQLLGHKREEEMRSIAQHVNYKSSVTSYIRWTLAYCMAPLGLLHPCTLVEILWCSCIKTAPTKLNTILFFHKEKNNPLIEMHTGWGAGSVWGTTCTPTMWDGSDHLVSQWQPEVCWKCRLGSHWEGRCGVRQASRDSILPILPGDRGLL